ncbi:MAG TPA: glycosyltransferase family 2 protein [Terriglobales bacterium]|nr:glycosyltransferase family 2 protein [Terriglobales bacterium]
MRTLAVVVLNWNGLDDTRALLPSLARCRVPVDWRVRVLVVDNGSSDGSVPALEREFPEIELLPQSANLRFAGGSNAGVRRALDTGADAVMLLNNDTEADPGLFERLLLALAEDPRAGAAAPLVCYRRPLDVIWYAGGRCVPALGWAAHRGLRRYDRGQYRSVEETGYLTGCCLLATRAAWEKVGLLDESYHLYAEDADWCLRARAAGFRLLFVPTARLWHKVSASSGAASPWKIYQRVRANLLLFARHARGIGRVTWLPCFLAQQAALALWLLARGHAPAAAAVPRALADALARRPAGGTRA